MQLTTEQKSILQSTQNITINAVAGSGKTTTLIEFAKVLSPQSSILYLAFNKSVKIEAEKKFKEANLQNVQVETAHSLAYKHVVYGNGYKVKSNSYTTTEIADLLALKGSNEKHTEYILANHVNKYMSFFCNSNVQKVQELNYSSLITDEKAAACK